MGNVPHHPSSGPASGGSGPWVDLIAFIGVLALGGILIAFGHVTAGSLAAACAALGGLYAVWQRFGPPGGPPPGGDPPAQPNQHPSGPAN